MHMLVPRELVAIIFSTYQATHTPFASRLATTMFVLMSCTVYVKIRGRRSRCSSRQQHI